MLVRSIANDDHVIDDHLLAFVDREPDVGPGTVVGKRHLGLDDHAFVPAIAILDVDAVARGDDIGSPNRAGPVRCRHQLIELGV